MAEQGKLNKFKEEYDLKKSAHPFVILLSLIMKGIPVACYLVIFWLLFNNMTLLLVSVFITSTLDFWYVKNISGRILVGLRWTRKIDDNGDEEIVFEHRKEDQFNDPVDSKFFWGLQYLQTLIWAVFILSLIHI